MWTKIPCSIYRGGTSKGLFLRGCDLPTDTAARDALILSLFGSPDKKQINGLGGATPTTSKLAIVEVSARPDADVDYTFGQVSIDQPSIDYKPNCGNISSAVGPFAAVQGIVSVPENGMAIIRIFNTNTKSILVSRFEMKDGQPVWDGETEIPGVPGFAAPVYLDFFDAGGAVTGRLFPSGTRMDEISGPNGEHFHVTIVDVGNLTVVVDGDDLGFSGFEVTEEEIGPMLSKLEHIRVEAGRKIGLFRPDETVLASTHALPKIAVVASPVSYRTANGKNITKEDYEISARVLSMGTLHPSYAVTGGIALSVSAKLSGTVSHQKLTANSNQSQKVRIGHPAGILEMEPFISDGTEPQVEKITLVRTARLLMEGQALIGSNVGVIPR